MINVKIYCPKCNGELLEVGYQETLKVLKKRTWYRCSNCGFTLDKEKYWSDIGSI